MNELRIEMTLEIARSPDEVFAAWTTADALASWFAPMTTELPKVQMDFEVGGRYSIEMPLPDGSVHTTAGEFREIEPGRKIVMTWHCDAFADPPSLVIVEFESVDGGTRVNLVHEQFATEPTCDAHRGGWEACLAGLRNYLEGERA